MFIENNINGFDLLKSDMDLNTTEIDISGIGDLFFFYYINFVEIMNYWLFLLEEIFRVFLAFYIIYLIIFEVHSVNLSYIEDLYFTNKK